MPAAPGYTVFTYDGTHVQQAAALGETPGDALVAGRHDRCDLVLPDDPSVSLRHLLLRVHRDDYGTLTLDMLNLRAPLELTLCDGSATHSLQGSGIVAAQLGQYSIIGLPSDLDPSSLPNSLPTNTPLGIPASQWEYDASSISRIGPRRSPSHASELPLSAKNAAGRLLLETQATETGLWLSADQLRRGVVVGRYTRCVGGTIRGLFDDVVSRTHLLFCGEAGKPIAYDLASRNGVWQDGQRVRRIQLDTKTTLSLGRKKRVLVTWEPSALADFTL